MRKSSRKVTILMMFAVAAAMFAVVNLLATPSVEAGNAKHLCALPCNGGFQCNPFAECGDCPDVLAVGQWSCEYAGCTHNFGCTICHYSCTTS